MDAANPAAQVVRDIIEASQYLVLATADETGRPWGSPVYFAHIDFAEFFWVSSPGATHSHSILAKDGQPDHRIPVPLTRGHATS
jgi:predicted pyridoxine 5'-phosphate oxidase superfamily flavin-nucleotide-binding protein